MPTDAKCGLLVGVGLVLAVAVLFFQKEPPAPAPVPVATPAPTAAVKPPIKPAGAERSPLAPGWPVSRTTEVGPYESQLP